MTDEIRADYDKLGQVAQRFAAQQQATAEMTRKVRAAMQKLEQGGWIGRGADAFFREMNGVVLPALKKMDAALAAGSQVSKEISQRMRSAEEEASSPFKRSS